MVDEIKSPAWPSDIILSKLARLETVILGVEGSEDKGMAGDVKILLECEGDNKKDIARLKVGLYIITTVMLSAGGTLVIRLIGQ